MHQTSHGWKQLEYFTMVTLEDEEEAKKPHGKGRVESLKLISTNYTSPKRKFNGLMQELMRRLPLTPPKQRK
jgi:hypothetical protein